MTTRKWLYKLAEQDATVAAYLHMADHEGAPWGSTMEKLVVALVQEKRAYFNQAVDVASRSIVPITLPLGDPKLKDIPQK